MWQQISIFFVSQFLRDWLQSTHQLKNVEQGVSKKSRIFPVFYNILEPTFLAVVKWGVVHWFKASLSAVHIEFGPDESDS